MNIFDSLRNLGQRVNTAATRPLYNDRPDAPMGGGGRGLLQRFGRGFTQGATPNTGMDIVAALVGIQNPLIDGLGEALKDSVTGTSWYQRMRGNPYFSDDSLWRGSQDSPILEDWQRSGNDLPPVVVPTNGTPDREESVVPERVQTAVVKALGSNKPRTAQQAARESVAAGAILANQDAIKEQNRRYRERMALVEK